MLDRKRKRLFLLAVYLLILVTSIALLLWGYDPVEDSPRGLAVSLATELFSVAFVFFLVDYVFTIGDWDLSERVTQLVDRLQHTAVAATDFFQAPPDLEPYIRQAQQIDLCGVTLSTTINKKFVSLEGWTHETRTLDMSRLVKLLRRPAPTPLKATRWPKPQNAPNSNQDSAGQVRIET